VRLSGGDLVACVDGGNESEGLLPVAAAWAHRLGTALTIVTVAEPSPPPLRPGASWHRHHGPDADAEKYMHQLADQWRTDVPTVKTEVAFDPLSAAEGIKSYLATHQAGLLAVTTHARAGFSRVMLGSGAAGIINASTAPVLVVPLR
jgi:nucleotide-binding universal stress UspA family protein